MDAPALFYSGGSVGLVHSLEWLYPLKPLLFPPSTTRYRKCINFELQDSILMRWRHFYLFAMSFRPPLSASLLRQSFEGPRIFLPAVL
jgi:hypothetical protein